MNITRLLLLLAALAITIIGIISALPIAPLWIIALILVGGIGIGNSISAAARPRQIRERKPKPLRAERQERKPPAKRSGTRRARGRNARQAGEVKWFNQSKGFGFIVPDDGSEDCFVHHSAIEGSGFRSLRQGQRVEFVITTDEHGRRTAAEVSRLGD